MSTADLRTFRSNLPRNDGESDADYFARVAAAYNQPAGRTHYFVSARTLLWQMDTPQRGEALLAAVKLSMPATYEILMQTGSTDGTAGGLDLSEDGTRGVLASLVEGEALNAGEQAKLLALSDTYRPGAPVTAAAVQADALIEDAALWEEAEKNAIADVAAAYVTAVEQWLAAGGQGELPAAPGQGEGA